MSWIDWVTLGIAFPLAGAAAIWLLVLCIKFKLHENEVGRVGDVPVVKYEYGCVMIVVGVVFFAVFWGVGYLIAMFLNGIAGK